MYIKLISTDKDDPTPPGYLTIDDLDSETKKAYKNRFNRAIQNQNIDIEKCKISVLKPETVVISTLIFNNDEVYKTRKSAKIKKVKPPHTYRIALPPLRREATLFPFQVKMQKGSIKAKRGPQND